jgi:hypothetical protein
VNLSVLGRLDSESESNVRGKIASDDGHGEFGIEEGCMNECQVIPQLREEAGIIIALWYSLLRIHMDQKKRLQGSSVKSPKQWVKKSGAPGKEKMMV